MRELFRTEYNLTSDMDWYRFIPATKDEMDEYEREQGLGPCSVTHPYIDPGWRTCRWNKTIFGFVLQDFISQCVSRGMSTDDEGYLYALIVDKCDRGFQTWRRMRPKPGEDIPKNIARNARKYTEGLEKARTQANRRNVSLKVYAIPETCWCLTPTCNRNIADALPSPTDARNRTLPGPSRASCAQLLRPTCKSGETRA